MSDGLKIRCRQLAAFADDIVAHLLTLTQHAHSGTFDRGDVDEYILSAVVRLDEAESLLRIEKLYCANCHDGLQWNADRRPFAARRVRCGVVCEFNSTVERTLPLGSGQSHCGFVPRTSAADSDLFQVAFLDHPFVRLAHAFDAVLLLATVLRKLSDDLVFAVGSRFMDRG
jgi:hypothetical protein